MLDGATLKRANLRDANLERTNLQGADLRKPGCKVPTSIKHGSTVTPVSVTARPIYSGPF
jgi:hypothetical protein